MTYSAERAGVLFVEGAVSGAKVLGPISSELNDFFSQNHLKSLDDLKDRMAVVVRQRGGNAVVQFEYGQRSRFWKSLVGMDNVYWYGRGQVAVIEDSALTS